MIKILTITLAALIIVSCSTSKKTPAPSIIPGDTQLIAIKVKYPEVTLSTLTEGHSIYIGACTNCHGQKNIFKRSEASWLHEIDDMSPKANLTVAQKDALTKYILAMKATQPVESK